MEVGFGQFMIGLQYRLNMYCCIIPLTSIYNPHFRSSSNLVVLQCHTKMTLDLIQQASSKKYRNFIIIYKYISLSIFIAPELESHVMFKMPCIYHVISRLALLLFDGLTVMISVKCCHLNDSTHVLCAPPCKSITVKRTVIGPFSIYGRIRKEGIYRLLIDQNAAENRRTA